MRSCSRRAGRRRTPPARASSRSSRRSAARGPPRARCRRPAFPTTWHRVTGFSNWTSRTRSSASTTSARTASRGTGSSHSRSARNQRRRSSYGTAAFAGEVDGSTKSAGRAERAPLRAELGPLVEETAVRLLADERDRAGSSSTATRSSRSAIEVAASQVARAGCRPRRRVRDAEAELEQRELLLRVEEARREAGVVQQPPEVVARVREVRGGRGGDAPRVDPAEDAGETGREDVRDGGLRSACGHAAYSVARLCVHVAVQTHELGSGGAGLLVGRRLLAAAALSRCGTRCVTRPRPRVGAGVEALLEQLPEVLAGTRRALRAAGREPHHA